MIQLRRRAADFSEIVPVFWGIDCSRIACHSASKFRSLYTDFRKYTFPWTNR